MAELSVTGLENNFFRRSSVKANISQTKVAWYNRKYVVELWHTLVWITIFALPFLIRTSNNDSHKPGPEAGFVYFYIVTRFFWIGFFYLNAFTLFPKLISAKRYWYYILSQLIVLFLISLLQWQVFNFFVKSTPFDLGHFFVFNTFTYLFILAASIAYKMIVDKIATDKL